MSPRIIHIPLPGGDRKAQTKGIRYAHGLHETYFKESIMIAKIEEIITDDGNGYGAGWLNDSSLNRALSPSA
jgi:hypothetical protein